MSTRLQPFRFFSSQPGFGLLLILSLLHIPAQSRGELAVQIINSAGATPGGTGAFDIVITNPGGPSVDLYGFSIEFTVNSTNVTFTSADTSVNTALGYVFANNAVPALALGGMDQDGFVSDDNYASNGSGGYQFAYQTIAFGETYGLAHISYTMNSGAGLTGDYSVAVLPDSGSGFGSSTYFTTYGPDGNGGVDYGTSLAISYSATTGSIAVVPEPSTLVLGGCVTLASMVIHFRRRRTSIERLPG